MKSRNRSAGLMALAFVLTTLAADRAGAAAAQPGESGAIKEANNDIAGSWQVTATPTGPQAPFKVLETYARDGVMIADNQGESACCPLDTPAHGAWKKTGPHTFAVTFISVWYNSDTSLFGTLKVRQTVTLSGSGDQYNGVAHFQLVDPNGNELFSGVATLEGSRIVVEPLP